MSNVLISIASQLDNKGFKQADFSIKSLTKSVAKLSGGFITLQKAQQAMLGYMADEKATKVLAQNLKNLGLGFATQSAEEFISVLQKQTGILDDDLRPAYAQLARVTGSSIETQKLMTLAFDVSAGSGQDYANVIDALSQAYVGNTKGLRSLNIGLSTADLNTKSFAEITSILNKQFAGSGNASLDSYAGKMAQLKVATSNASEAIGKGLLDAITTASGSNGFPAFIKSIEKATNIIVDLVTGTGRLIALLGAFASPSKGLGDMLDRYRKLRKQWDAEDLQVMKERSGIANNTSSYMQKQAKAAVLASKNAAVQKKLEADRLAILKKTTAEKKAAAAIEAANKLLLNAQEKFDLEGIQIQAALMNASNLNTEELYRLSLKKAIYELEQALASEDQKRIASATAVLEKLNAQFAVLGHIGDATKAIGENKDLVNLDNLNSALAILKQMYDLWLKMQGGFNWGGGVVDAGGGDKKKKPPALPPVIDPSGIITDRGKVTVPSVEETALEKYLRGLEEANKVIQDNAKALKPIVDSGFFDLAFLGSEYAGVNINPYGMSENAGSAYSQSQVPININIDGNISNLIDVIVNGLQEKSASGIGTTLPRNTGSFDW